MAAEAASSRITHRRVLTIAVPIVISNATVPLLGVVDTGVVGQMGAAAPIGAVGIGAIILTAFYWLFGFLRMATTGLASQARGAGNEAEYIALLMRALLTGGVAGLAIIALQWPLFWAAFEISPATPEVEALARDYMGIRVWSAPAAIAVYGITGWLIAAERTRAVLALQVWMNGVNILLDLWFVLGLDWGVNGVALATFIAEWSGLAVGLWLCRDGFATPAWKDRARIFDRARIVQMMAVNRDILLRSVLLEAAFISFLFTGSTFGDVTLAANQILLQFLHVTAYALDGFAFAAEALVGHALGARARSELRRAAVVSTIWGAVIGIGLGLAFALLGGWTIDLMTTAEPVRIAARSYLCWMVLAPVIGVWAWMFDGIFIGATRGRDLRNMMLVSALIYAATAWVAVPPLGNHGLWLALLVFFAARGITLAWKYPGLEAAADA